MKKQFFYTLFIFIFSVSSLEASGKQQHIEIPDADKDPILEHIIDFAKGLVEKNIKLEKARFHISGGEDVAEKGLIKDLVFDLKASFTETYVWEPVKTNETLNPITPKISIGDDNTSIKAAAKYFTETSVLKSVVFFTDKAGNPKPFQADIQMPAIDNISFRLEKIRADIFGLDAAAASLLAVEERELKEHAELLTIDAKCNLFATEDLTVKVKTDADYVEQDCKVKFSINPQDLSVKFNSFSFGNPNTNVSDDMFQD